MPEGVDPDGNGMIDGGQIADIDHDGIPDIVDQSSGFSDGGVSIEGYFWIDNNGDGVRDPDESEIIPNATVELLDKDGNPVLCHHPARSKSLGRLAPTMRVESNDDCCRTTTDENGYYRLDHLKPDIYQVRFTLPEDKRDMLYSYTTDGSQKDDVQFVTYTVDARLADNSNVQHNAAVQCACSSIQGDSIDALSVYGMLGMLFGALLGGWMLIRREERTAVV
jgi:hypothetical protein